MEGYAEKTKVDYNKEKDDVVITTNKPKGKKNKKEDKA